MRLSEIRSEEAAEAPVVATETEVAPEPTPVGLGAEALNGEQGRVEVAVGRGEAVTFDLGALLSEFQRGVEAQLSGDAQGHYDLAMTYREMGLLEQAVESFRLAGRDATFRDRCAEMIGRCLLDQGQFEEAASEFGTALQSPDLPPEIAVNMRYQLGLALEASGRSREALTEFERVFATHANFSDVALKIRVLRKTLEQA
jgi:tetratricopeptide (TPR) repeat protein